MAAFDQIRLLHLKKYLICTLLILKRIKFAKQRIWKRKRKKKKDMLDSKNQKQSFRDAFDIGILENFTRKYLCWSLFFNKVPGLQLYEKRGVQHRCFPVKFAKLLRTLFLQNIFGCCFWKIYLDRPEKGGYILLASKKIYAVIWLRLLLLLVQNASSCVWITLMFGCLSYFYKGDQTETAYITKSTSLRYFAITCYWRCFCSHWR